MSSIIVVVVVGTTLPPITIVWVPGGSGCRSATQPWPTESPPVPAGSPKTLFAGRTMSNSGVTTSVSGTDLPSRVTVGGSRTSDSDAHVRSSASEVPSNVLHSTEEPTTKILVPGFTVHDSTPSGPNAATVPPPVRRAARPGDRSPPPVVGHLA